MCNYAQFLLFTKSDCFPICGSHKILMKDYFPYSRAVIANTVVPTECQVFKTVELLNF